MSITTGKVKGLVDKCQGNNSLNTFNNTLSNPGKKVYVVPKHIMFATSYDLAKRQCTLCYQPEERQEKMPPPLLWKIPLARQGPLGYQQVCMYWKTTTQHWLYKLIFHSANKYGLIVPYQLISSPSISQPSHSIVTERTNKNNRKPTPYCLQRVRGFFNVPWAPCGIEAGEGDKAHQL